jgi:hypothetical protein
MMNKDALLATIIGFIIGLCLTVIIVFGPNLIKSINSKSAFQFPKLSFNLSLPNFKPVKQSKNNYNPPPKDNQENLSVDSPQDESIVDNENLAISGKATQKSKIILSSSIEEKIYETNSDGLFVGSIKIKEGKNIIHVLSIQGKSTHQKLLTIYYTSEKL